MEKSIEHVAEVPRSEEKPEYDRTPGLKMLDVFLYPVLTNISVFGVSVAATYLTTRGGDRNAAGQLVYGKFGKWFQDRGTWMTSKFKALGMSEKQADMWKMVTFSFLDGSAMAPVVKMLEDRREQIGRWLDEKMGTVPKDDGVYEAEPKQSWLSLLGGRAVTLGIVLPTAMMLDKGGLNEKFFNKPGKDVGGWLAKKPWVKKNIPAHWDVQELTRVGFFEAFYTSVCTLGLYFTSRRIANFHHKSSQEKEAENADLAAPPSSTAAPVAEDTPPQKPRASESLKRPRIAEEIVPTSHLEKYNTEAASNPAMLGV